MTSHNQLHTPRRYRQPVDAGRLEDRQAHHQQVRKLKRQLEDTRHQLESTELARSELKQQRTTLKAELQHAKATLRSARTWQKCSPLKRLLHRWRAPGEKPAEPSMVKRLQHSLRKRLGLQARTAKDPQGGHPSPTPPNPYQHCEWLRVKLRELGFHERALGELTALANDPSNAKLQHIAAWELALWHIDLGNEADTRIALQRLTQYLEKEQKPDKILRANILAAEAELNLGESQAAADRLRSTLDRFPTEPDLLLAQANVLAAGESSDQARTSRLSLLNQVFAHYDLPGVTLTAESPLHIDTLLPTPDAPPTGETADQSQTITVILTAYNAEATILTALRSVASQTWQNLQVLVVDDCSTDATAAVVADYILDDPRFSLLRSKANSGPYVCRNLALDQATGTFLTCHDADDWSHPGKLETQARWLVEHPDAIATLSEQARVYPDMRFHRRGSFGFYIFPNYSSLMFRREEVTARLGYWDCVRFGADSEFIQRLRQAFGEPRVIALATGPLSFQRQSATSLTGNSIFGYHGYPMGARRDYAGAAAWWHTSAPSLLYAFPQSPRPFAVPLPMTPEGAAYHGVRHMSDAVLAADLRESSPDLDLVTRLLEIHQQHGIRTRLVQLYRYQDNPHGIVASAIRDSLDGEQVRMCVAGEKISTDMLLVIGLSCVTDLQAHLPDIVAGETHGLLPDQAPEDVTRTLTHCTTTVERLFKSTPVWHTTSAAGQRNWRQQLARTGAGSELIDSEVWRPDHRHFSRFLAIRKQVANLQPLLGPDAVTTPPAKAADATLEQDTDTFVLYRVIGNDLVPRHARGQSRSNLTFILDHEPELEGCEKRWIVNRIADPEEEQAILNLLDSRQQHYLHIPFDSQAYLATTWDFTAFDKRPFLTAADFEDETSQQWWQMLQRINSPKNNYVMHNNGGRNAALEDGRGKAKWICPWDGNCYLTTQAWQSIRSLAATHQASKYLVVPMARTTSNERLLDDKFQPPAKEEPQIIFRSDAAETFDEAYYYGRRPKVELLYRLGVPGPWWSWANRWWDLPRPAFAREAQQFASGGWVARLNSGRPELERSDSDSLRSMARDEAIITMLDRLDEMSVRAHWDTRQLQSYAGETIESLKHSQDHPLAAALKRAAETAIRHDLPSVLEKSSCAPSGDPHDYWHPAPFWWPDPQQPDGLPYIRKDGQRAPGTSAEDPEAARYDRNSIRQMLHDTTVLALAHAVFGNPEYGTRASDSIRTWFLNEETRMNPHLRYAHVRRGHNNDEGTYHGIVDFTDICFLLDAIRLLEADGLLTYSEIEQLREWLATYRAWLLESPQGQSARQQSDAHGTCFDLQRLAISAYLDDVEDAVRTLRDTFSRVETQFTYDGQPPTLSQPENPPHHSSLNLQAWSELATIAHHMGLNLWNHQAKWQQSLDRTCQIYLKQLELPGPASSAVGADGAGNQQQATPLFAAWKTQHARANTTPNIHFLQPTLHPVDCPPQQGVKPFWQLALPPNHLEL